jgi:hypothetical protein
MDRFGAFLTCGRGGDGTGPMLRGCHGGVTGGMRLSVFASRQFAENREVKKAQSRVQWATGRGQRAEKKEKGETRALCQEPQLVEEMATAAPLPYKELVYACVWRYRLHHFRRL